MGLIPTRFVTFVKTGKYISAGSVDSLKISFNGSQNQTQTSFDEKVLLISLAKVLLSSFMVVVVMKKIDRKVKVK